MEMTARLLITENTESPHSDPHSIGILEVPYSQIK